ncbi:nuclear protein localization protein 4 homolog [Condylostylus longicornis]|uniref:nuclear protein localization protein 4 homolog n=1 Tax=Condylostylus longicornis TaxID=2530218 RepID=UPI00244E46A2|nr:nuclear protein localization protein 4 homolog [Condylostylus longicornis]
MTTTKMLRNCRRWQLLSLLKGCSVSLLLRLNNFLAHFKVSNMEKNNNYDENIELSDTQDVFDFPVLEDIVEDNVIYNCDTSSSGSEIIRPKRRLIMRKGLKRDCVVFSTRKQRDGRRQKSKYCDTCPSKPRMHMGDCFQRYHTIEKDQYGNEVQRLARPLPVEYLLVDVPASTPLTPLYTFTSCDRKESFPVENRYIDGHLQDFNALSSYLSKWTPEQFLEAVSDFHFLLYLYKMDMLPMKNNMSKLFEAVKNKDKKLAAEFKKTEVWATLETLISASSGSTGGTGTYPGHSSSNSSTPAADGGAATSWTCNHCTFINRSDLGTCEMCGLPR